MDIFDSLKAVYSNSTEKIMLCDERLMTIWRNNEPMPKRLDCTRIRLPFNRPLELPLTASETVEYVGDLGESYALKIEPITIDGKVKGYLLHFFTCEDIELLSDRSDHLKFKTNYLGNIRIEMAQIINMLDSQKDKYSQAGDFDYLCFDRESRYRVLKTFSATVNINEISKYYNGYFECSFMNISNVMEEICSTCAEALGDSCKFDSSVQSMVYLRMNSERLKAAVTNLIANAVMYNDSEEKLVRVSLACDSDNIVISVTDNGGGIDDNTAKNAATPFRSFRSYGQNESLGLAVVNKCCEFFGGRLEITRKDDEYTEVKMVFQKPEEEPPSTFKAPKFPPVPNPYDMMNSILAKAVNPFR